MRRILYTKPEIEKILAVVNFDDLEEPVFLGKWNKKTTKELALELHKGEATINRYLDSALLKIKDAYDKNLIKM
jgi:hypothetical protein